MVEFVENFVPVITERYYQIVVCSDCGFHGDISQFIKNEAIELANLQDEPEYLCPNCHRSELYIKKIQLLPKIAKG